MVKKRITLGMLILCLLLSAISIFAADERTFPLTDIATGNVFTVCEKERETLFILNGEIAGSVFVTDFDACTVYSSVFTLFTVDSLNKALDVYRYDINSKIVTSFSVKENPYYNDLCFTADDEGTVYFVSAKDTMELCIYKDGAIKTFDTNTPIKQLLYLGINDILIATSEGVLMYRNGETKILSTSSPAVPLSYSEGVITDINGENLTYSDPIQKEDEIPETVSLPEASTSAEVAIGNIIIAEEGATVSKIKKSLGYPEISEITKADGKIIESGKLGTGTKIKLISGAEITVIIYGELTGEGNINSKDIKAILNHLSEKELLTSDALTAADIDKDGEVTTNDALMIAWMIE